MKLFGWYAATDIEGRNVYLFHATWAENKEEAVKILLGGEEESGLSFVEEISELTRAQLLATWTNKYAEAGVWIRILEDRK